MKRYILFGFSLLMAFPASTFAQDDLEEEEEQVPVKIMKVKQKNYETRVIKGLVLDATTGQPGNNNEFMFDFWEMVPKSVYGVDGDGEMEDDL